MLLTGCAETRTGGEFGDIDNLDGKLLTGLPVYASSDYRKRTPEKRNEVSNTRYIISPFNY